MNGLIESQIHWLRGIVSCHYPVNLVIKLNWNMILINIKDLIIKGEIFSADIS